MRYGDERDTPLLTDQHRRRIDYLRISVTDRCNLKCIYCMPAGGVPCIGAEEALTTAEIIRVVRIARRSGLRKVRITGGEPLVRKDLIPLIRALKQDIGIRDLSLTTNGLLLAERADRLKEAGLDRVNVSLDTMDPDRYRQITRGGDILRVWDGIDAAEDAGLLPLKINMVPLRGVNEDEIRNFALLTLDRDYHIRFIEFMPTGGNRWSDAACVRTSEVRDRVEALGRLMEIPFRGNGPSRNFRLSGARGVIGFISAVSDHFCSSCNRLRLTADGKLRPCLYSEGVVDMRPLLRNGSTDAEISALFTKAAQVKPSGHLLRQCGASASVFLSLSQIGG